MAKKTTVSAPMASEDKRWRAEDAVRTLTRAEEIRKDSGLMRDVRQYAQQQQRTLAKVAGGASSSAKAKPKR